MRTVLFWLSVFIVCSYCNVDFKSIGWYVWRCKVKLGNRQSVNAGSEESLIDQGVTQDAIDSNEAVLKIKAEFRMSITPIVVVGKNVRDCEVLKPIKDLVDLLKV